MLCRITNSCNGRANRFAGSPMASSLSFARTPTRRVARTGQGEAKKPRLIPRRDAFERRGVFSDCLTNWGGIRSSDDTIVMSLWADDIRSENGACSYLLWAPNQDGSRPWSDKPGGKERLKHCVLAAESGRAEGLLVYGERLEGRFPEDKATTVSGVDPAVVLEFRVEHRGQEYWAVWGARAARTSQQRQGDSE